MLRLLNSLLTQRPTVVAPACRSRCCRWPLGRSPIGEIGIVDTKFGTHLVKINERNEKWDPKKTKTDGGWSF